MLKNHPRKRIGPPSPQLASKLAIRLILLTAITGAPTWFLPYNQLTWWDWFISDIAEYSLRPVVVFSCFAAIPWERYIIKLTAFLYGWLTVFNLSNYIIQNSFDFDPLKSNLIFYSYMILGACVIGKTWTRHNLIQNKKTEYDPSKTYIARKRPASFRALVVSVVYQWPMDTVSIIHKGQWYKMNETFTPRPVNKNRLIDYYLEEVSPDDDFLYKLQLLVGTTFHLIKRNCYRVVSRIIN